MKKILFLLLSLYFNHSALQAKDKKKDEPIKTVLIKEDNRDAYYYEGIVPVEGVVRQEMFKRAKEWVLSRLQSHDNNIKFDEKEFSITNSSTFLVKEKSQGTAVFYGAYVMYNLIIQFKEGQYKFRFDNVIVKPTEFTDNPVGDYSPKIVSGKEYNDNLIIETNRIFSGLAVDLEDAIKGKGAKKGDR